MDGTLGYQEERSSLERPCSLLYALRYQQILSKHDERGWIPRGFWSTFVSVYDVKPIQRTKTAVVRAISLNGGLHYPHKPPPSRIFIVILMGMEKVLQSIKKAEQAAEQTLSDAQSESSRILSDARRDAADLVAKATEEAQASIQSTLDAAKEAAMKNVVTVQKEGAKAVESVESDAGSKQDSAVALIVEKLLNQ